MKLDAYIEKLAVEETLKLAAMGETTGARGGIPLIEDTLLYVHILVKLVSDIVWCTEPSHRPMLSALTC